MKNIFKYTAAIAGVLTLGSICSPVAKATDLLNDPTDTISSAKFTQSGLGRLSRSGTAESWIGTKPTYPGSINATTNYVSTIYTFSAAQLGDGPYVEFTINAGANVFVSAWTGSYNLTATAGPFGTTNSNFLGDQGGSGNFGFTGLADPNYFQAIVPAGGNLIVVVTDTVAGGVGTQTYGLTVANFSDKEYTDAIPGVVPEPATWAMLGAGALIGGVTVLRRRRATV